MFKSFLLELNISAVKTNYIFSVNSNDLNVIRLDLVIKDNAAIVDLTGKIVRLAIRKPDNTVVFQSGGVTDGTSGKCEFILEKQAALVAGRHEAEVMIYEGDSTVAVTTKFYYEVKRAVLTNEDVESSSDFPAISQAIAAGEILKEIDIHSVIEAGAIAGGVQEEMNLAKQKDDGTLFGTVQERLNDTDEKIASSDAKIETNSTQLASAASNLIERGVNVKKPPAPLVGAKGDGVTDDSVALQAIINYVQDNAISLYIPSGTFLSSQTLIVSKRLKVFGDGMRTSKIKYSGTGVALRIKPSSASHSTFYDLRDFSLEPSVVGGGTYGLEIELVTGTYFSNWEMYRVFIGDFGSNGMFLNNNVNNANGFFTATIRKSWITNGIKGTNIGDSISILENTITGKFTGVDFTHLAGARQVVIKENNITTAGGVISLVDADQPAILNNQLEHQTYMGNYTGTTGGFVYLKDVTAAEVRGNTISPAGASDVMTAANYAILIDGTSSLCDISNNTISRGETHHVGFTAATANNTLSSSNNYDSAPIISNLSTGTNNRGIEIPLTPLNNWVTYETASDIHAKKLDDGLVVVRGSLKSGTVTQSTLITYLPAGLRPNRKKRFQVTNFNGTAFSSATLLVETSGAISILSSGVANNLLQLDGIQFTTD